MKISGANMEIFLGVFYTRHRLLTLIFFLCFGISTDIFVASQSTDLSQLHRDRFPGEEDTEIQSEVLIDTGLIDEATGLRMDPRQSWLSFVKHSSERSNSKKCKCKKKERDRGLLGIPGPEGPEGPRGPPGPPGAEITKEEILNEFKSIIREAAEMRANLLIQENCPSCARNMTRGSVTMSPEVADLYMFPPIPVAFHCKLENDLRIPGKKLVEITNFHTPYATFTRGQGLDVRTGRFTVPRTAIYQLSANLHVSHKLSSRGGDGGVSQTLRPRDYIRLLICINSLCISESSLEFITGVESNSRVFSVSVSGLLRLEAGQYVSVSVDNRYSQRIQILKGSDFSGLLMGT